MNRKEHLLTIEMEECAEVAHRASKAMRFGLHEVQHGQDLSNAERLTEEFSQLFGMMMMLHKEGFVTTVFSAAEANKKQKKVEEFLEYSRLMGTLTD
jgi:hypothetical protein